MNLTRLWRRKRPQAPPPLAPVEVPGTGVTDLRKFLLTAWAAVPPSLRGNAEWHMSWWWWEHIQRLDRPPVDVPALREPTPPDQRLAWLLGAPVIRDESGWPHLRERQR